MMGITIKRLFSPKYWLLLAVLFSTSLFAIINSADEFEIERATEKALSLKLKAVFGHDSFAVNVDFAFPSFEKAGIAQQLRVRLPGFDNEIVAVGEKETAKNGIAELSNKLLAFIKDKGLLNVPQKSLTRRTSVSLFLNAEESARKEKNAVGLIQRRLHLDLKKGDKVRVLRDVATSSRPTNSKAIAANKRLAKPPAAKNKVKSKQPVDKPKQLLLANQTEKAQGKSNIISNSNYKGAQMLSNYLPQILIAAFLAVIFILLLTFFWLATRQISRKQELKSMSKGISNAADKMPNHHAAAPQSLSQAATKQPPVISPVVYEDKKTNLAGFRQELVSLGLSHSNLIRSEGAHLWTEDRMDTIVALYQLMGRSVFQSVFGELDIEKVQRIQEFNNEKSLSSVKQEALVKAFYESIVSLLLSKPSRKRNQAFRFLESMNNNQILYLLKDQSVRVRALVLSQLPAKVAADILHAMDEEQSAAVTFELAQFESFPVKTFQDIANSLARKAENVPSFNNLQTEGISIITDLLDNMSPAEEKNMMRRLRTQDPELHQRLRRRHYSFYDIARTPKHILSNVLPMLEQKCLATALIASEDDIYTRVIDALPNDLSNGLVDEIEIIQNEATPTETEEARKVIVSRMRAMIATGRFAMSDLEKLS